MRWRMIGAVACLAVAAVPAVSGGSASAAGSKPVKGGTITWIQGCHNPKLDPIVGVPDGNCAPEMTPIYDVLLFEDPTDGYAIKYHLAESLSTKDNVNWVLKLRPNLEFTDNTALDASAVKTIWDRHKDPALRSVRSSAVANIASLTVQDTTTLNITLTGPQPSFPFVVARNLPYIPSPTAIQKYGDSYGTSPDTTVGAGPFILKQWLKDSRLEFDRNPNYWDAPKPYVDHLVFQINNDGAASHNAFKAGQTQGTYVGGTTIPQARADGLDVTILQGTGTPDVRLLNVTAAPFDDVRVRQAMNMAVDPKALNATYFQGLGTVLKKNYLIPPSSQWFDPKAVFPSYDPKKAQALFDEVAKETGKPVEIHHLGAGPTCAYGEAIQTVMSRYQNVKVAPDCLVVSDYATNIAKKQYQYALWICPSGGTNLTADPDPGLYDCFHSQSRTNITNYSNPKVDALLEQGRAAGTVKERKAAYDEVQEILVKDLPMVVIPVTATTPVGASGYVLASNVKGFSQRTAAAGGTDFEAMWLTKS